MVGDELEAYVYLLSLALISSHNFEQIGFLLSPKRFVSTSEPVLFQPGVLTFAVIIAAQSSPASKGD